MTRYYSFARLPLALLAVLALAGPAAAEAQDKQVPFKGVIEAVSDNEIHFPTMSVHLDGGGTATHLGRYTFTLEGTATGETSGSFEGTVVFAKG